MRVISAVGRFARRRRVRVGAAVLAVALTGGAVALHLDGAVTRSVGPLQVRFSVDPSAAGGFVVALPPLGSLRLDTHSGPLRIDAKPVSVDVDAARAILDNPQALDDLPDAVSSDARSAVEDLAIKAFLVALAGAVTLAVVVFRRWRPVAVSAGVATVGFGVSAAIGALTFSPQALAEPHYSGLLTQAPALIGGVQNIVDRFGKYSAELAKLVTNVSQLYDVTSTLPAYAPGSDTIRVLHVSDIHDNPAAEDIVRSAAKQFDVDAVLDTGDITDHGTTAEDQLFSWVGTLGVPYVFIRGNHDSVANQRALDRLPHTVVLDDQVRTVAGLRIYGVGDPRFTPDKTTRGDKVGDAAMARIGRAVADRIAAFEPPPVDVAMVHDPAEGGQLGGVVPLVLAGHIHHREHRWLDSSTLMLVEGSTGAAGLRGLEGEKPTPFELSVLYFDQRTHRLQAWDDITLGGLGESSVQIDRHVVTPPGKERPSPTPAPGSGVPTLAPASATPQALAPDPVVPYAALVSSGGRRERRLG